MNTKHKLHPRNKHRGQYDFAKLAKTEPLLAPHIISNKLGKPSINFANSDAVKLLNRAILKADYQVSDWDIPKGFLCPPIPGRVDYIHYLSDLLATTYQTKQRKNPALRGLDIGTGAGCIYPLLGRQVYQWQFVASDIDSKSIKSSQAILDANPTLNNAITLRLQNDNNRIFHGIINDGELFDFTLCNPPFHESLNQANAGSERKRRNLGTNKRGDSKLNFGGQNAELWCKGGEKAFVGKMISESVDFSQKVLWFSSLISNKDNLRPLKKKLEKIGATEIKVVNMAQGQKVSRFLAWTFLTPQQQQLWCQSKPS